MAVGALEASSPAGDAACPAVVVPLTRVVSGVGLGEGSFVGTAVIGSAAFCCLGLV